MYKRQVQRYVLRLSLPGGQNDHTHTHTHTHQESAEAIEAVAHGDESKSRVVGRAIEDVHLPNGATISAIVRGDDVLMAHHDTVIEEDDHIILFMSDRRQIDEVERLFEI